MFNNTALTPVILVAILLGSILTVEYIYFKPAIEHRDLYIGESSIESPENLTQEKEIIAVSTELVEHLATEQILGNSLLDQTDFKAQTESQQRAILRQVTRHLADGKQYEAALSLSNQLDEQQRILYGIQFVFAATLTKISQHTEAIAAYQSLIASEPENQAAVINLGLLHNRLEQYREAENVLLPLLDVTAGNRKAKVLSALATAMEKQNNRMTAEAFYSQSVKIRPNHASTWAKLADVRKDLGMPLQDVSDAYKQAIQYSSTPYRYSRKLGEYLLENLNFEQSSSVLKSTLSESNKDDKLRRSLAWALFESGNEFESKLHWEWLSTNSNSKNYRLLAEHMIALMDRDPRSLKSLPAINDEFRYARAVLKEADRDYKEVMKELRQVDIDSDWYPRAQRRITLISQQINARGQNLNKYGLITTEPDLLKI
jgi:tetratricopeptide (TPR) repeat protein